MRTRPITLSKTCPYCGARSRTEAKLPVPANAPKVEYNLDDLGALVARESLSLLLALVELLPYKTFVCAKCAREYRLESQTTKSLVGAMLGSMQPVIPAKPSTPAERLRRTRKPPGPGAEPPAHGPDWEAESLDAVLDTTGDSKPKG